MTARYTELTRHAVVRLVPLAVMIAVQALLAQAYYERGTSWHFLLHTTFGLGLGLSVAALVSTRLRRPVPALPFAAAGEAVSVLPDLLFVLARVTHMRWMDVFVGHIRLHLVPGPLVVAVGLFAVGGWAWWLASPAARPRAGATLASAGLLVTVLAFAAARPLPTSLTQVDGPAWWCGS